MPKVGVALPVRNGIKWVERCITTLRAQTYPVSIYIVDDASDDGTDEFLTNRPSWYTQFKAVPGRRGSPRTLHEAAEMAVEDGCEAIFTMNADDFLRVDAIEKLVNASWDADVAIAYSQQVGGEHVVQIPLKWPVTLYDFYAANSPVPSWALWRSWVWKQAHGYLPTDVTLHGSWGYCEDWDFWIKAVKLDIKGVLVPEPLYYNTTHDDQLHKLTLPHHAEARRLVLMKHFGKDWHE